MGSSGRSRRARRRRATLPLLSNLMLDVLDKEPEKRGHRSCAMPTTQHLRAQPAGRRAGDGRHRAVSRQTPRAQGQQSQQRGRRAARAQGPGLQLHERSIDQRRIAPQTVERFKAKVRELTRRTRQEASRNRQGAVLLPPRMARLFGFCETPSVLRELDQWIGDRCAHSSGSNGSVAYGFAQLRRRGVGGIRRPKPPAAHMALGGSATAPRSPLLCRTSSSAQRSASQPWRPGHVA